MDATTVIVRVASSSNETGRAVPVVDESSSATTIVKQKKMKQLDALSKELKAELEDKNTDPKKIREQAKKLDKLSKAIQSEQRQIAGALGIQS